MEVDSEKLRLYALGKLNVFDSISFQSEIDNLSCANAIKEILCNLPDHEREQLDALHLYFAYCFQLRRRLVDEIFKSPD